MIAAVVLAAGASTRLGRPKQLLLYQGSSLLRRTVDCAADAGYGPVIVVVGAVADAVSAEVEGLPVEVVRNDAWQEGMGSSIRAGVQIVKERLPRIRAVVLLACDQPLLTPGILRDLGDGFDGVAGRMVACEYAGTVGVPALFERSRFEDLLKLRGPGGAKSVLEAHPSDVVRFPWPDGSIDIDRPEDLHPYQ